MNIPTKEKRLPENINYLCIEGVIGAGKTTLCNLIAQDFSTRLILEEADENPFLVDFYKNRQTVAFQTQMWFLLSRYRQLYGDFNQQDLFYTITVSDYVFEKDSIFASITLDENELSLYSSIYRLIQKNVAKPDFVIYLQTSTDKLLERIEKRGRIYERGMEREYIETLNSNYDHFFFHYKECPVLVVNTDHIDYVNNREDYDELIEQIYVTKWGCNYYNPIAKKDRNLIQQKKDKK